jgi:hypothetical protein
MGVMKPNYSEKMANTFDINLPFDEIYFPMGENEFTRFHLTKLLNHPGVLHLIEIIFNHVVLNHACQLHNRNSDIVAGPLTNMSCSSSGNR